MKNWPFIIKTPIRLQVNPIECGAVALAIVLEYFGRKLSSESLHQLVGVSRDGSNARSLVEAAKKLGLKAHAQRAIIDDLPAAELAILFFDNCHFVVYEGRFLGRFFINDPARGRYSLSREQMRRRFSGVSIALSPPDYKKALINSDALLAFMRKYATFFIFGLGCGWMLSIIALSTGFMASLGQSATMTAILIVSWLALFISTGLFWMRAFEVVKARAHRQKATLLSGLKRVRPSFFTLRPFARFKTAIKIFSMPKRDEGVNCAWLSGIVLPLLIVQATICWWLALLALAGAFISALIVAYSKKPGESLRKAVLGELLGQSWINYPDLDAMGQNSFLFAKQIGHEREIAQDFDHSSSKILESVALLPFFLVMLVIFYLNNQSQSVGTWPLQEVASSLPLCLSIFYGAMGIGASLREHLLMLQARSFMAELLDQAYMPDKEREKDAPDAPLISVHNASFHYPGSDEMVLGNIDLSLEHGRIYGVTGPPRSGTSTLLKILAQKLPWSEGIMSVNCSRWALIDDEAELFHGSLWDNVTLFDHRIKELKVVEALYAAGIEELFLKRPLGLLTLIEERGKNVSMGQKKRLLLARALVHKPKMLLLDDFFDTLDEDLALKVLANLRKLGITVIFSSWRPPELMKCDKVIMLAENKMAFFGSYDDLTNSFIYQKLMGFEEAKL